MNSTEPIQSTTGALAGNPANVMEPVAQMLQQAGRAHRNVRVVLYVSGSMQAECDRLTAVVREAITELGVERAVDVKIRSGWVYRVLPLLRAGAWRAPILEVNGKIFSQGIVPDKETLKTYLRNELSRA